MEKRDDDNDDADASSHDEDDDDTCNQIFKILSERMSVVLCTRYRHASMYLFRT